MKEISDISTWKYILAFIIFLGLIGIMAGFFGLLLTETGEEGYSETSSSTNFTTTSLTNTLTPVEEGITSATVQTLNQTWLEFDGVDDRIDAVNTGFYNTSQMTNGFTVLALANKTGQTTGFDGDLVVYFTAALHNN